VREENKKEKMESFVFDGGGVPQTARSYPCLGISSQTATKLKKGKLFCCIVVFAEVNFVRANRDEFTRFLVDQLPKVGGMLVANARSHRADTPDALMEFATALTFYLRHRNHRSLIPNSIFNTISRVLHYSNRALLSKMEN